METADFLPLTSVAFEVLLALSKGDDHGYAVMKAVNQNSAAPVHPGTLYRAIARLLEQGLLAEEPGAAGERRRVYRLTTLGREVAAAEAARLSDQVERAAGLGGTGLPREA